MNISNHGDRQKAYLYLILTTAIWGSLYVVTRIALKTVPPITLLFFRYVIASLTLYTLSRLRGNNTPIKPGDRKMFIIIGAIGYFVSVGAQVIGTKYAGASIASLINSMNPVVITVFAVIILKEKLTRGKILATIATLGGAYIILGGASAVGTAWGIAFSLASVLIWSLTSIRIRRLTQTYNPLMITQYAIFFATLCSAPVAAVELSFMPHGALFSTTNILCFLYLGIIATALPNLLWNKSLSLIEASTCSLFYPIQPLVSVLLGVTILHEKVDIKFGIGALFIVGGILYAILSENKVICMNKTILKKIFTFQNSPWA